MKAKNMATLYAILAAALFMVKDTVELQYTHEHELSEHQHVYYA